MSKLTLPYILVVEGAMDQAFLSQFLDVDFVQTNGSAVSRETIEYLKEASKTREIVVLTDPDSPGEAIRNRIAQEVPTCKHAWVRKKHAIKGHKVGVAEASKDEVLLALSHVMPSLESSKGTLTAADLAELGLTGATDSSSLREKVSETFHVGKCNGKTLLARLNALGVSKEQLRRALYG